MFILWIYLGFFHEHVRYDRDRYVSVDNDKVAKLGLLKQFGTGGSIFNQEVDNVGYDYESVMHYPDEGLLQAKVSPTDQNTKRMGWYYMHDEGLSPKDKIKLKNLYQGISKGKYSKEGNCKIYYCINFFLRGWVSGI